MTTAPRERFAKGVARLTKALTSLLGRVGVDDPDTQAHSVLAELIGTICLVRTIKERSRATVILAASQQALKRRLGLVVSVGP
jgi:TetR/AcrR family transcriptional repressor of nem operon